MVLVEGEEVVVQQQLHLAHRVLDDGGFQLALPDDDHMPAVFLQQAVVFLVALAVAPDFLYPEVPVARRNLAAT